ncbi:MAG: hypothetical protein V9E90_17005, partial [Saprospiraceae bacterium]
VLAVVCCGLFRIPHKAHNYPMTVGPIFICWVAKKTATQSARYPALVNRTRLCASSQSEKGTRCVPYLALL